METWIAIMLLGMGFVFGLFIGGLLSGLEVQEFEPYSSYADLSIFKDGKVTMDYVNVWCIGSKDSNVLRCKADLVFNDRAVGFVNFKKQKQERT